MLGGRARRPGQGQSRVEVVYGRDGDPEGFRAKIDEASEAIDRTLSLMERGKRRGGSTKAILSAYDQEFERPVDTGITTLRDTGHGLWRDHAPTRAQRGSMPAGCFLEPELRAYPICDKPTSRRWPNQPSCQAIGAAGRRARLASKSAKDVVKRARAIAAMHDAEELASALGCRLTK